MDILSKRCQRQELGTVLARCKGSEDLYKNPFKPDKNPRRREATKDTSWPVSGRSKILLPTPWKEELGGFMSSTGQGPSAFSRGSRGGTQ